eukprot:TRINITY_DN2409_c0_g1_i24.p1 TRINITY_DN2409_c0_g1~~TRINITY_DN2409_c0_g1_i24.p1  ORF type:complete len:600 (+),score=128.91 TRINITY_DN2409_c0_g1_i24:245-2044(+)
MTEAGRDEAIIDLEGLTPKGSTNIWAGLSVGLESLRNAPDATSAVTVSGKLIPRKRFLLLLTDGQPTESPPQGEDVTLRQYYENHADFKCQVSTFGFGYSLKSKLLLDIATCGHGTFSFIPDAKIIGTCFVTAIANACSNLSQNCYVHMEPKNGATFAGDVEGCVPFEKTSWGYVAKIGPLQYGQSRDVVVPLNLPPGNLPYLEITVEYESATSGVHKVTHLASHRTKTADMTAAYLRNYAVRIIYAVISECSKGTGTVGVRLMKSLVGKLAGCETLNQSTGVKDVRITAINADVSGRVSKAISTVERWNRWGQHYLRAIARAHQLQMKMNFMDPGLQYYGGRLFSQLEKECGEVFLTLPMKKSGNYGAAPQQVSYTPTISTQSHYGHVNMSNYIVVRAPVVPAVVNNATYYGGGGGGCFDGSCRLVATRKGSFSAKSLRMQDVQKGDSVLVVSEEGLELYANVLCVVRIKRTVDDELVEFKKTGLKITKKHPVRLQGVWCKPVDLLGFGGDLRDYVLCKSTCSFVYNLILDVKKVLVLVNDMECPTFGHGFDEYLAWHPFYASDKVLQVVQGFDDYSSGCVTVVNSLSTYSDTGVVSV